MVKGKKKNITEAAQASASPLPATTDSDAAALTGQSTTDISSLLQWMIDRDERRRVEEEEKEERRKEEEMVREKQRREDETQRFQAFLAALNPQQPPATPPPLPGSSATPPVSSSNNSALPPPPKPPAQPPPPLATGVTYQTFREWRQRWSDYATMVDLSSMPQPKQLIQLRACLSLQMQRVLEYTLQVAPDSSASVEDVLSVLQAHIKGQNNEALRRRAFSSCKQATGETFDEFYVRLKSASEEIDVCKARDKECEEAWIKHGILMGVQDEELTQKLIALDTSSSLQDVLTECRSHEATRSATSALRAPASARALSQYKKGKKATHNQKIDSSTTTTQSRPTCDTCGRQHGSQACRANTDLCRGCGRKGHWAHGEMPGKSH